MGGRQRPVINLKGFNQFVKTEHFKMEGLHLLPDFLQPQDWMVKMDLKDAYLQIPIHPDYQHLLTFKWEGKTHKFQCLPFGLSAAPRVFTKLLKPVVGFLRQIPGQHTDDAPGKNPSRTIRLTYLSIVRESGDNCEPEVHADSNPRVGVLGLSVMLNINEAVSTHRETLQDPT